MTGISFEQLNLYSQLSAELLMPTSMPAIEVVAGQRREDLQDLDDRVEDRSELQVRLVVLGAIAARRVEVAIDPHQCRERSQIDDDAHVRERGLPALVDGGGRIDTQRQLAARVVGALVLRVDLQDAGLVDEGIDVVRRQQGVELERALGHLHQAFAEDLDLLLGVGQSQRIGDVGKRLPSS